jgi:hypothetical protein
LKQVKDGELTSSIGLQGIYRLAAGSAAELAELIETAQPVKTGRIPPPRGAKARRIEPAPEEVALF